jgi:hypothetical protein
MVLWRYGVIVLWCYGVRALHLRQGFGIQDS